MQPTHNLHTLALRNNFFVPSLTNTNSTLSHTSLLSASQTWFLHWTRAWNSLTQNSKSTKSSGEEEEEENEEVQESTRAQDDCDTLRVCDLSGNTIAFRLVARAFYVFVLFCFVCVCVMD